MKRLYILLLAIYTVALYAYADRRVSYARINQKVTLNLDWTADNYGEVAWQTSNDNGQSWQDVESASGYSLSFQATSPISLYRAVIKGDPACPPIIQEREVRTVDFKVDVVSNTATTAELEISSLDLGDAEVVEYGFTSAMNGVGRVYSILPRTKVGDKLPEEESFVITCTGLAPATQYSLRPYIKTSDGSLIFGTGKLVTTLDGLTFDTEDWIIEKDAVQVPFSLPGYSGGNPKVEFWFGSDEASLQQFNVEDLGDHCYRSELLTGLNPATTYMALVKADINGEAVEIRKYVKTWSDYSSVNVDETVKPVSHMVEWDSEKKLICLTPETLQVEYPRMCRVDENKILLTYHGGVSDHWQNSYLRKSYDNGKTWTEPVEIYNITGSFLGSKYNRICNPEMTKLSNGWIILTVVANGNPETNANCKVLATISKDGGETWGNPIVVGRGRTWEPQVVQLPGGELELLVSSEAYWWDNQRYDMYQEILSTRSTDNGETWTAYKRASYKPAARDGMPVAVVMQGNKGVLFVEESVNGNVPPTLVHRGLDQEWDTVDWDNIDDDRRWKTKLNSGAGAPYMIQLPTGEFLIMAHTNQTGDVWQTNRPQVIMADNTGHDFKYSRLPLSGADPLPAGTGAYYNSFFLYDNDTVWLLITKADYKGQIRTGSDVMILEGKIVEK
ncbi:MAG: glycoside hydrolase [Muribaculaceae bacterium]|nr:glycoside hydrolase [Muribaculaceae bacterium]